MSGSAARLRAIDAVSGYKHDAESFADEAPGEVFGLNVFTKSVMKARLPKSVYTSVLRRSSTPNSSTRPSPMSSPRR